MCAGQVDHVCCGGFENAKRYLLFENVKRDLLRKEKRPAEDLKMYRDLSLRSTNIGAAPAFLLAG